MIVSTLYYPIVCACSPVIWIATFSTIFHSTLMATPFSLNLSSFNKYLLAMKKAEK
jgi:hypothetical protein